MAWKRYKDPVSGDEFTADERAGAAMGLEPIDKDAVDGNDRPLAPKQNIHKGGTKAAATQKDG